MTASKRQIKTFHGFHTLVAHIIDAHNYDYDFQFHALAGKEFDNFLLMYFLLASSGDFRSRPGSRQNTPPPGSRQSTPPSGQLDDYMRTPETGAKSNGDQTDTDIAELKRMFREALGLVQQSAADAASASESARYALSVVKSINPHFTSDAAVGPFTDVVVPSPIYVGPPSDVVGPSIVGDTTFTVVEGKGKGNKGKGGKGGK